jgi:hypothetical protein
MSPLEDVKASKIGHVFFEYLLAQPPDLFAQGILIFCCLITSLRKDHIMLAKGLPADRTLLE